MSTKAALKAAKQAIDREDWTEAETQAKTVLASDNANYFAKLFLGRSLEKQARLDDAAQVYHSAADLKPEDLQAWLGLCSLYEAQGAKKVDEYAECAVRAAELFGQADDVHRCQVTIDKVVLFVKKNGSTAQYKRALQITLPGSPIYHFLEGRLPHPALTFTRLAELTEKDEKQLINKEIGERRTRLGARVAQVTEDVKRQVYGKSELEDLYRSIIDWTLDDEVRASYDDKLLQRVYDNLCVLPADQKEAKRLQVLDLAQGMVIIKRPCQLAWDIYLEWFEAFTHATFDANVLHDYIELFPSSALSKTLRAFLGSEISPFPVEAKPKEQSKDGEATADDDQAGDEVALSQQDRLFLMSESLGEGQGSTLAHRIVGEYYLHLEEYESAIETTRNGLSLLTAEESKAGVPFPDTRDALTSTLATCLVHHQAPRNHAEAEKYFRDILDRRAKSTPALIGLGLIHEEQEQYADAIRLLDQALEQDPENVEIGTESAWCRALSGDTSQALVMLERYLPECKSDTPKSRDLKAQTLYRIGRCLWDQDTSKSARKDRNGAYARFLSSIKTNVNFAPAYTSLGFYYSDYARDKKRARQCFQKAFELSSSEVEAAERLARAFAEKSEWDIVESIAQRVMDSGKVRPPPGSKKRGISWPFSALGVVQMTRLEYSKAVTSFLSALKIKPDDYHSYVGLGESYHNSGRYNSASRTFYHAENPPQSIDFKGVGEKWFTEYMLANVHRELGEYATAITGLNSVLVDRPDEFGVLVALLQTRIENAWRCIETGSFGQATDEANEALGLAEKIVVLRPTAFNLWKAVGDGCSMFLWAQAYNNKLDIPATKRLLFSDIDDSAFDTLSDVDHVTAKSVQEIEDGIITADLIARLAILAYKRAIHSSADDIHAQAVAWYNLGWAEYRAYAKSTTSGKRYLKAAVRCFKRSIELEAGNSEFWNSLGVATSQLNAKVAQHAFVRSLHLNEHSARTWTNLGVLYLLNNDIELAHEAFARAQSTDPEYAHAWLGEGLIAQLLGSQKEAVSHFTHGFEISDASSLAAKKRYGVSTLDDLLTTPGRDITSLLQPLFALQQLRSQEPANTSYSHLSALLSERVGDHEAATQRLESVCEVLETEYEDTEAQTTLVQFAHAKADLARNQLATQTLDAAAATEVAENAQTALDLLSDSSTTESDVDPGSGLNVQKIRLSAYLTIGLAKAREQDYPAAIDALATAHSMTESTGSGSAAAAASATTCLLAKVLWSSNQPKERALARSQITDLLDRQRGGVSGGNASGALDVDALVLAATMAAARDKNNNDGNDDKNSSNQAQNQDAVMRSLTRDLEYRLTGSDTALGAADKQRIHSVLRALAALSSTATSPSPSAASPAVAAAAAELSRIQTQILVEPHACAGWEALARRTGCAYAWSMAVDAAMNAVARHGEVRIDGVGAGAGAYAGAGVNAEVLAGVLVGTGVRENVQRGVMLAPWIAEHVEELKRM